jgi:hypothetical protein
MKKIISLLVFSTIIIGCRKVDVSPSPQVALSNDLKIANSVGIKLQTPFVTTSVDMNVKSDVAQTVTIKITDIANSVVSKEIVNVAAGDNVLKVYTSALPTAAYRIALYDTYGNLLGITDFNKN